MGPTETHAFALLPSYVHVARETGAFRPLDLRAAALRHLGRLPAQRISRVSPRAAHLSVVTYNVHSCLGLDDRLSPARIARVLEHCGADIIALQELDVRRGRTGHVDQAEEIAAQLGMQVAFYPALAREGEQYGDAILSRFPFHIIKSTGLPNVPDGRLEPRGALWAAVDAGNRPIQVVNTHLGLASQEQRLQVEALLGSDWLAHPDCQRPTILSGDLNMSPRSPHFRRLAARLRDVQTGNGRRPQGTWISYWPRLRIDHVLVSKEFRIKDVRTIRSKLAREASDHLPLVVDLELQ